MLKKEFHKAIIFFTKAIDSKNDYFDAYINLGNTYSNLGNIKEAVNSFKKAIQINPYSAIAFSNLGDLLKTLGN